MKKIGAFVLGFAIVVSMSGCAKHHAKPKKKKNFEESKYCYVVTSSQGVFA